MRTQIIEKTLEQTLKGQIVFPDVVATLVGEGVCFYQVDLLRHEHRYYDANGASFVTQDSLQDLVSGGPFSAEKIKAAIRQSQAGQLKYPEFMKEIGAAGCVFYVAYLDGKNVAYFGRTGDVHVEHFPQK